MEGAAPSAPGAVGWVKSMVFQCWFTQPPLPGADRAAPSIGNTGRRIDCRAKPGAVKVRVPVAMRVASAALMQMRQGAAENGRNIPESFQEYSLLRSDCLQDGQLAVQGG